MRYIIAIFVTIILGLPYALDAFAGKIVEFQGSKYEVVEDENGEMLFKPVGVKCWIQTKSTNSEILGFFY